MRNRRVGRTLLVTSVCLGALAASSAGAQFPDTESEAECPGCGDAIDALAARVLAGTWSSALTSPDDAAWSGEDFFCFIACTPEAWAAATALLRDPANAQISTLELFPRIVAVNVRQTSSLLLGGGPNHGGPARSVTAAAEPITCDPHGFASQVLSPLPLRIEQHRDRFTLRYEEFAAERVATFEARSLEQPSRLGNSTARFENGSLIIETTELPAGRFYDWFSGSPHSDRLRAVERYSVSGDGQWLNLEVAFDDPATLREPLRLRKRWRRIPDVEILPYSCDAISGVR